MNRALLTAALSVVLVPAHGANADDAAKKLDVKVLYAGAADAPRTKEFAAFLGGHFVDVGTVDNAKRDAAAANGFDVVIVDSPSPYRANGKFEMPRPAALPADFGKPTILMGAAGGNVLNQMKIKLNWL